LKQPKGSLHIPILKKELEALQTARDEERTTFITDRLKDIPRYKTNTHASVLFQKSKEFSQEILVRRAYE
jgi:hypothetical protein